VQVEDFGQNMIYELIVQPQHELMELGDTPGDQEVMEVMPAPVTPVLLSDFVL